MKKILLFSIFVLFVNYAFGQLVSWDFSGNAGDEVTVNGVPNPGIPEVTGGVISRGPGINANNNANRFNANSFGQPDEAAAIANGDYFEFNVSVTDVFCITNIVFNFQRSNTGPENWTLRSSLDGFSTNLMTFVGLANGSTETVSLPAASFSNLPAGTVTFRFYGYGNTSTSGSAGFEGSGDDLIINGGLKPLPVELTAFNATLNNKSVALNWTTATEQNNSHFDIEHSTDGTNFRAIDEVAGNGTTQLKQEYSFLHTTPAIGANYYRLKQVDFDGAFEYSDIRVVEIERTGKIIINPSAALSEITVELAETIGENNVIGIYDMMGRMVMMSNFDGTLNVKTIDISNLQKGYYVVRVQAGSEVFTERFMKMID